MPTTTPRGALPLTATLLTASVALYMALVAFGNIPAFGTNQDFVRHVLAMDTTFKDDDLMWRAITNEGVQDAAYVAIIVWETDLFAASSERLFLFSMAPLILLVAVILAPVVVRRGGSGRAARVIQTVRSALVQVRSGLRVFRDPGDPPALARLQAFLADIDGRLSIPTSRIEVIDPDGGYTVERRLRGRSLLRLLPTLTRAARNAGTI